MDKYLQEINILIYYIRIQVGMFIILIILINYKSIVILSYK